MKCCKRDESYCTQLFMICFVIKIGEMFLQYDSKQACETLAIHGGSKFNSFLTKICFVLVVIYAITSD